jgi:hypothetical protein
MRERRDKRVIERDERVIERERDERVIERERDKRVTEREKR